MTKGPRDQLDPTQGTLDMLVLRTLLFDPLHGSLYPALQRPERRGWVPADWGTSENNRRARYYRLTAESLRWGRLAEAVARIMRPREGEG